MSRGVGAQYQAACEKLQAAHADLDEARKLFRQCRDASKAESALQQFYRGIAADLDIAEREISSVRRRLCLR